MCFLPEKHLCVGQTRCQRKPTMHRWRLLIPLLLALEEILVKPVPDCPILTTSKAILTDSTPLREIWPIPTIPGESLAKPNKPKDVWLILSSPKEHLTSLRNFDKFLSISVELYHKSGHPSPRKGGINHLLKFHQFWTKVEKSHPLYAILSLQ